MLGFQFSIFLTHPLVADKLLVADGLVGLEIGHWARRGDAVAEADVAAAVVVPALVPGLQRALFSAARTLREEGCVEFIMRI